MKLNQIEREKIENQVITQMMFAIPKPKTIEDGCRLAVELTIDIIQEDCRIEDEKRFEHG